jgi:hypothetical protein
MLLVFLQIVAARVNLKDEKYACTKMSQVMVAYRMMACRMHACTVSPLPAGGEWNPDTPGSNVLECVHNGAAPGAVPWQHEGYLLMTNAVYHVNVSRRYQLPRLDLTRSRCLKSSPMRGIMDNGLWDLGVKIVGLWDLEPSIMVKLVQRVPYPRVDDW